jgi:hypothetical protein
VPLSVPALIVSREIPVLEIFGGVSVCDTCNLIVFRSRFEILSLLCQPWQEVNGGLAILSMEHLRVVGALRHGCPLCFDDRRIELVV